MASSATLTFIRRSCPRLAKLLRNRPVVLVVLLVVLLLLLVLWSIVTASLANRDLAGSKPPPKAVDRNQELQWNTPNRTRGAERKVLNIFFAFNAANVDVGGGIFEADWISNVLLGALERPLRIVDTTIDKAHRANDTITVFLGRPPTGTYFEDLKKDNFVNQGAFHMADELMADNIDFYKHVTYVFRNYYNQNYEKTFPHVRWVPLGMKSGFGPIDPHTLLLSSKRKRLCNFVGSLRSNRMEAVKAVQGAGIKCHLDYGKAWAAKDGMTIFHYRNLVSESVFTLAPWGNNPESLRLYEAMEAGSIPIFQRVEDAAKNPLTGFGPSCPVPQFADWKKAADYMAAMEKKPALVDELQEKIIGFWQAFKRKTQAEIKEVIDKAFKDAYGYEC